MKRCLLALVAFSVATGCSNHSLPDAATAVDCPDHDIAGAVSCYSIEVAENPAQPDGRRVGLEVMVLEARAVTPEPDPLFVLPGGPGQSATRSVGSRSYFAEVFDGVRENRDVVLVAPRGTAGSGELRLVPPEGEFFAALSTLIPPSWVAAERERLMGQVDLTQYTTSRIVDDLDQTRRALGYERINLYGTSYGTRVAQLYGVRYPRHVRSMILKAPVPPGTPIPLIYAAGPDRALRKHFAYCAEAPACVAEYGDIETRFEALLVRLAQNPAQVSAKHPYTHASVQIEINDAAFGYLLRNLMMSASGAATVLAVIDQADTGQFGTVAALTSQLRAGYATELAGGMALSVIAAEDAPRVSDADLAAEAGVGFLKDAVARGILEAARDWPQGEAPADLYAQLQGDVPVLLVTGDLDPATPPEFARRIADGLANARVVIFAGGAHSANNFIGLDGIMSEFIDTADPWAVDVTAAETNRPLPLSRN